MNSTLQLVFFLEEPSMKKTLEVLLPRFLPEYVHCIYIVHEGKQDLEKSIPRKLKAQGWNRETKFVIVRDQDSADCFKLKRELIEKCEQAGKPNTLIRIACHELESWFLGDLFAVEKALRSNTKKRLSKSQDKEKFRNPDAISLAKQELKTLFPTYQQNSSSGEIAKYLNLDNNKSRSFQVFIQGVKKIVGI